MSATDRQNRLLVAEDWKRIYQSYRNADFQSYDFENLRRTMISYLRENYPEDFNDYIESSEYLALIDLLAFLGQNIAFRVDLNARENFLELAERRDSVLRLARLLSYSPKRNIAASGLLKFTSVSTTQTVVDSNGRNLAGQTVLWNDPANTNWYDQFIKIINASVPSSKQFGNPDDKKIIYGVPTEQYRFQSVNSDVPVYSFTKTVDGRNMDFEIVSTVFTGTEEIYEESPSVANNMAFLYREDGKGPASNATGFFLQFKQGTLNQGTFSVTQPSTNEVVDLDAVNVNNSDVWLYKIDNNGFETEQWAKVPSLEGNNIIYNSLQKNIKNIFTVITRANDRISLSFSDGTFGNLPMGTFRVYYRISNGLDYTINPKDIRGVTIDIPYVSNVGQVETLTVTLALQSSVANSTAAESNAEIKNNAPATYYTQNRMITAEDYNISPRSVSQSIAKIKSVNRSSSGISRYFDLVDPTGKYSKTNLFADDGVIYIEKFIDNFKFNYLTRTDIESVIYNQVTAILEKNTLRDFYYSEFPNIDTAPVDVKWKNVTSDTNQSTGYFTDFSEISPFKVGSFTNTELKYIEFGALLKFTVANPATQYFDTTNNNQIVTTTGNTSLIPGATSTLWCKIVSTYGDGTNNNTGIKIDGTGTIMLNDIIPSDAVLKQIIPRWRTSLDTTVVSTMVDLIFANKPFGLRYDVNTTSWKIIFESNLNQNTGFSLGKEGDISNQKLDNSWVFLFTTDTEYYTVQYRQLRYIFESDKQVRFFFDASDKIYDVRSNTTVKDKIKLLSINTQPNSTSPYTIDMDWEISEEFKGLDGYIDTKKIQVTFSDTDEDSIVDNPELFEKIVNLSSSQYYVVLEKYTIGQGQEDYRYLTNNGQVLILQSENSVGNLNDYTDAQHFYFIDTGVVKQLNLGKGTLSFSNNYRVYQGRDNINFQYIHNADYESRIDPGITNIIDVFVLTKNYDKEFRRFLQGSIEAEPLPPSSDELYNLLSPDLNKIKSISDEIIYHPVKYKILFGNKAAVNLQATFKVVKNSERVVSDNDVKSRVLSAINQFFSLENWDFGDSFYFSELATYVMNALAPDIVNFIIVPNKSGLSFGSLFEIQAESDQLFVNGASVDNIEIITAITATKIKSSGEIFIQSTTLNEQNILSSTNGSI
jgi:hypothetical protein